MNLDRLLKLLKLANHNPNDAEANSAARAASKMLGEDNYKWVEDAKKNGGRPRTAAGKMNEATIKEFTDPITGEITIKINQLDAHNNPKIYQLLRALQAEIQRPINWNDVNRSERAWWKSNYEGGKRGGKSDQDKDESWGESTGFNWENEFWEKYWRETKERAKREQHERNYNYDPFKDFKKGFYSAVGWDEPPGEPKHVKYKKVYEKHVRDCTECGVTQLTSDDTTPFVCYSCRKKG